MKGPYRGIKHWGHCAGTISTNFPDSSKYSTPVCAIKEHELVLLPDVEHVLLPPY